ncbi:DUF4855 domain-containing protein [Pseudoneobacillus sp. C159]
MKCLRLIQRCVPVLLLLGLLINQLTVQSVLANTETTTNTGTTTTNTNLSESQFLSLLMREFAASDLIKMPADGTYKAAKVYHLAQRLGIPVSGSSYTTFGDDPIPRKKAAQIIAQAFTGKLYNEKDSIIWLYDEKLYSDEIMTYESFQPESIITKEEAQDFVAKLKRAGYSTLQKNENGKIGEYRVDSFYTPVKTYTTFQKAYDFAKNYHYTKVVDTASGMVLWYPEDNQKIVYHLYVNGKRVAGFDSTENAIAYAEKLEKYKSRIIEGIRDKSIWDNYDRYVVKSPEGFDTTTRLLEDAYTIALERDNLQSYIQPLNDDITQYTNSFLTRESANIGNGVIIYNGYEIDKKNKGYYELGTAGYFPNNFFTPYIAYQKDGKFVDQFFDTFIIAGRFYSEEGRFEETATNEANYKEWKWYKDRTLQPGGVISTLNADAAAIPEIDKVKVYMGIPYPKKVGNITKLDGTETTASYEARFELVKWYVDQMLAEFNSGKYPHLQFEGFYWLNETVRGIDDEKLVKEVATLIHDQQKRFIFSPHANATNYKNWKEYGFDAAYFQSNSRRSNDPDERKVRLHWGYMNAYQYGMGVNLEMEDLSYSAIDNLIKDFDPYMEFGKRYGIQGHSTIMYQGTVMMHRLGAPNSPMYEAKYREYYEKIYQFLRGK